MDAREHDVLPRRRPWDAERLPGACLRGRQEPRSAAPRRNAREHLPRRRDVDVAVVAEEREERRGRLVVRVLSVERGPVDVAEDALCPTLDQRTRVHLVELRVVGDVPLEDGLGRQRSP